MAGHRILDVIDHIIHYIKKPIVLVIAGWRIFFYSNEGFEPIHVHAEKAEKEIKFWIDVENFELTEAFAFNVSPQAKRNKKDTV